MVFTSLNFLFFFPALALIFYLTPLKWRGFLLLVASVFFYLNISPVYLLLLFGVTLSTYSFTHLMSNSKNDTKNRRYMIANIVLLLLPLFFFKYFQSINSFVLNLLQDYGIYWPLPELSFLLPVGISFYTFVAIGYTIDVYNEEVEAEKNIGIVALFISFFPLILSGPIERASNMLPQFKNWKPINFNAINAGLKLMLWGYFMKLVVADRLGIYIDMVYNNVDNHNGSTLLLTSILYPFQVYCDLGGYSLIAIGTAKVLGLDVMHNFKRPFFSKTMSEFWRRWHISLITWLTDYLYTPLSFHFRQYKVKGIVLALMLTFLISGIWHGAAITFLVWGFMQGVFLSIEALTLKKRTAWEQKNQLTTNKIYMLGCMIFTFILFAASQIFGRAESIDKALTIYKKIATSHGSIFLDLTTLVFAFFGLTIVLLKDGKDEFFSERKLFFSNNNSVVRYVAYVSILIITVLFGVFSGNSFIYFQF